MVFILHYRPRGSGLVNQYLQTKRGWGLHLARDFSREISMNTKMKALSLALVGLAGFAGSAMAACPAGPDIANGGAWTAVSALQGSAVIATPGYATTECRLDSTINAGASGVASGQVNWTQTTPEPSYRAQFIVDADAITTPSLTDAATIYTSSSGAGGDGVRFSIFGTASGARNLGYFVRYDDTTGRHYKTGNVVLPAGEVHVEYSLTVATGGAFNLWVENNVEATPTKTETGFDNSALVGINTVYLGLAGPSSQFVTHYAGTAVGFDQYDSRRTLFIGF
jgi:hypothetical protein